MDSYKLWLDNLFDGAYVVDNKRVIQYWNKAAEELTGYSAAEVVGRSCADNILNHVDLAGNLLCITGCPLLGTLCDSQKREDLVFLHHKQGHRIPIQIRVSPIQDDSGKVIGAIEIFSEQKGNLPMLRELEQHKKENQLDPLLQIGNRRHAELIFQLRQYELELTGNAFGVIFFDLDQYKAINDNHGHVVGDDVLKMVCRTTGKVLRQMDAFIRWGGDEFLIFLPDVSTREELCNVAERIRSLVENSFIMVEDKKVSVTVSLGATFARGDETLEKLVERVDGLMYKSKEQGGNRCSVG